MPTGYTAGILDGTTKDFAEYAKHCSRAFVLHMRDEPFDSDYKESEPSDYHANAIKEAKKELKKAKLLTDEKLIKLKKKELADSKKYHLKSKANDEANKIKLELFLYKAKS